jgi:hypothetical protein
VTLPITTRLSGPSRTRITDLAGSQVAILFFVLTLLISIPVWTHPLPPLSDYVNHLARMHVIATLPSNPLLARHYQVEWQIIPNLTMDLMVPLFQRFMNVYLAGQVFTVLTFALIVSGGLALNRALFGRWSVLPLVGVPLLYNYVFLVGVMNYIFGVGLALWALAAWVFLRERAWPLRLAVSSLFVIALFFCHLSALGVYGIGVLANEAGRLWRAPDRWVRRRLVDFVASGMPFALAVPLMLTSPTMTLVSDIAWEPRGKIDGLIYVIAVYSDIVAFLMTGVIAVGAGWAIRRGLLRFHPLLWPLLAVSALVYLALPRVMFATYMADQRIPIAVVFMAIATAEMQMRHRLVRRGFLAILVVLVAVRVIEVDISWAGLSNSTNEMRASVRRIKPGAKVLVAYANLSYGDDVRDLGLVHAPCIAMIERAALVSTAFTVVGKQILRVRPEFRDYVDAEDGTPPSISELVVAANQSAPDTPPLWDMWHERFDYLYVLFTEDDAPNPDPQRLTLVIDGDRFQLYRINKPG